MDIKFRKSQSKMKAGHGSAVQANLEVIPCGLQCIDLASCTMSTQTSQLSVHQIFYTNHPGRQALTWETIWSRALLPWAVTVVPDDALGSREGLLAIIPCVGGPTRSSLLGDLQSRTKGVQNPWQRSLYFNPVSMHISKWKAWYVGALTIVVSSCVG